MLQFKGIKTLGEEVEVELELILDIITYRSNRGCQCREVVWGCREASEPQIVDLQGKELDRDKESAKDKFQERATVSGSRCQQIDLLLHHKECNRVVTNTQLRFLEK